MIQTELPPGLPARFSVRVALQVTLSPNVQPTQKDGIEIEPLTRKREHEWLPLYIWTEALKQSSTSDH